MTYNKAMYDFTLEMLLTVNDYTREALRAGMTVDTFKRLQGEFLYWLEICDHYEEACEEEGSL